MVLTEARPSTTYKGNVSELIDHGGFGPYQIKLMFLCGALWMADAMEMMLLSFLLPVLKEEWKLTGLQESLIGSITFVGVLFGSIFWGVMADTYGRRINYRLVVLWTTVWGLLSALSPNLSWLLLTRGMVGFGLGGAPVAFTLFAEFLPNETRGTQLVIMEGVFWSTGAVFECIVAMLTLPTYGWRAFLAASTIPCFVLTVFLFWDIFLGYLPESPRFLMIVGRKDEAMATLTDLLHQNGKTLPPGFVLAKEHSLADRGSLWQLFSSPDLVCTTLTLWIIWFADVMIYYGIVLLTPAYFKSEHQSIYVSSIIGSFAEFPGLLAAILFVDSWGRCRTQSVLLATCSIGCLFLANKSLPVGVLTAFAVLARGSINGAFAVTYVYTPEVYATEMRNMGMGTASAMGRVSGIITPLIVDAYGENNESKPLILFAVVAAIASVVSMYLKETSKQELASSSPHGRAWSAPGKRPSARAPEAGAGADWERTGLVNSLVPSSAKRVPPSPTSL
jgi:MFS family permease